MADMSDIERLARLGDLVSPMAVRVAATLRLCDHVADGATTAPVLAELTGTHADTLGRLMRHLVAIGVMSCSGEHYALTEIGESMREGRTGNRGPLTLDINRAVGRANLASVKLLESVRTGGPAYPLMYGRGFWEDLAANPELGAGFDEFMGTSNDWEPDASIAAYDSSSVRHVVDVGGGNGSTLAWLVQSNPGLWGTLVELRGPADRAFQRFDGMGLADRVKVATGSFFDPLPPGADIYLLSAILHDWGDSEAMAILRRCAEGAGIGGKVLVVEAVLGGREDVGGMTAFDLFMLVCCGGRECTLEEFVALGRGAGLDLRRVVGGTWTSVQFVAGEGG
jgi:2,7-dihydroxy-5-methyl-1-naphthoate 7-O-methyltransferase